MRISTWWVLAGLLLSSPAQAACPPEGTDPASLQVLREQKFAVPDDVRAALVAGLPACLADPDPALRDGVAYEGLSTWLRAGQVDVAQRRALRDRLYAMLGQEDAAGFGPPFAALVLSEVARTDRIAPWMSADERADMVARAADYLTSVRDYRGFDAVEGWRHGVAHGTGRFVAAIPRNACTGERHGQRSRIAQCQDRGAARQGQIACKPARTRDDDQIGKPRGPCQRLNRLCFRADNVERHVLARHVLFKPFGSGIIVREGLL